jgi:undecaprenyl-diphosphatase
LAVIPGVSRSGATMTSGLLLGFTREDAAKFSFLMSIPIIFGAGLLKLKDFSVGVSHAELLVGFVSAAVFGFLSIKYLMQYLRTASFKLFVWYRIAFAVLILVVYFARR